MQPHGEEDQTEEKVEDPMEDPRREAQKAWLAHDKARAQANKLRMRIAKAMAGDPYVRDELFAEYRGLIYKVSFDICEDRELAKEVVERTLLHWFVHFYVFTGEETWLVDRVKRWVIQAAEWFTYSQSRKSRRHSNLAVSLGTIIDDTVPDSPDEEPERRILTKKVRDDIDDCFLNLPLPDQAAFALRMTGTTQEEMARALVFERSLQRVRDFESVIKQGLHACFSRKQEIEPDFTEPSRKRPVAPRTKK